MLVAITSEKKRIVLNSSIPITTLKKLKKEETFYCPQCGEKLQLKIGSIKIPHFAHYGNSICHAHFSEGESEVHLLGKEHLYDLFNALQLKVELEPYLSDLKQRPDLLLFKENVQYAIEYQCSPLHNERFLERNDGYRRHHIHPIWIPVTPHKKIKKQGIQKISLPHQLLQFSLYCNKLPYIITYYPYEKQFVYMSNWLHFSGNTYFVKVSTIPLKMQKFPFYLPKPLSIEEFSIALNAYDFFKKKYLNRRILTSRKGVKDLFLRSVYELKLSVNKLPAFLGVPLIENEKLKVSAVEWQTALFYFLQLHDWHIWDMNEQRVASFLKWTSLHHSDGATCVILNYCHLLSQLSIQHIHQQVNKDQLKDALYSQFLATLGKY